MASRSSCAPCKTTSLGPYGFDKSESSHIRKPRNYVTGGGQICDGDVAIEAYWDRFFKDIDVYKDMKTLIFPESFLSKLPEVVEPELIKDILARNQDNSMMNLKHWMKKPALAKGDEMEHKVYDKLQTLVEEMQLMNSMVFHSYQVSEHEKDFMIVCKDYSLIIGIEVKNTLHQKSFTKACEQLSHLQAQLNSIFASDLKSTPWQIITMICYKYCNDKTVLQTMCEKCAQYCTPLNNFDEAFKNIFESATKCPRPEEYLKLLKGLASETSTIKLPNPNVMHDLVLKNVKKASDPLVIDIHANLTPDQSSVLMDNSLKRVLFISYYSTGKTMLMRQKALMRARMGFDVVIAIGDPDGCWQLGFRGIKTLLYYSLCAEFQREPRVKVIMNCGNVSVEDLLRQYPDHDIFFDECSLRECGIFLTTQIIPPNPKNYIWIALSRRPLREFFDKPLVDGWYIPNLVFPLRTTKAIYKHLKMKVQQDIAGQSFFSKEPPQGEVGANAKAGGKKMTLIIPSNHVEGLPVLSVSEPEARIDHTLAKVLDNFKHHKRIMIVLVDAFYDLKVLSPFRPYDEKRMKEIEDLREKIIEIIIEVIKSVRKEEPIVLGFKYPDGYERHDLIPSEGNPTIDDIQSKKLKSKESRHNSSEEKIKHFFNNLKTSRQDIVADPSAACGFECPAVILLSPVDLDLTNSKHRNDPLNMALRPMTSLADVKY